MENYLKKKISRTKRRILGTYEWNLQRREL